LHTSPEPRRQHGAREPEIKDIAHHPELSGPDADLANLLRTRHIEEEKKNDDEIND